MKPDEYLNKLILCEFELDIFSKLHFHLYYFIDEFVKIKHTFGSGTRG